MELPEDRLWAELLDSMPRTPKGEPGPLNPALEAILVRIGIWLQHGEIAPTEGEGTAEDFTDAGHDFIEATGYLCVEPLTTEQLKDRFVKACKDHVGVKVSWNYWRLRVEADGKAAASHDRTTHYRSHWPTYKQGHTPRARRGKVYRGGASIAKAFVLATARMGLRKCTHLKHFQAFETFSGTHKFLAR